MTCELCGRNRQLKVMTLPTPAGKIITREICRPCRDGFRAEMRSRQQAHNQALADTHATALIQVAR